MYWQLPMFGVALILKHIQAIKNNEIIVNVVIDYIQLNIQARGNIQSCRLHVRVIIYVN